MHMSGDDDGFLLIDDADEDPAPPPRGRRRARASAASVTPASSEATAARKVVEAETVDDAELVTTALSGEQAYAWELVGMDCSDCAMKATKAVKRLDGIVDARISASDGRVQVTVEGSRAHVHRVNEVLSALGHSADVQWKQVTGVTWSHLEAMHDLDRRGVRRLVLGWPGVLAVDTSDDGSILVQQPSMMPADSVRAFQSSIEAAVGRPVRLRTVEEARLRPDQRKLLGGAAALVALVIVFGLEWLGAPELAIAAFAAVGVVVGGWTLLSQAVASLRNRQVGFQLLMSLAVVGALLTGHWEEALLVVLLDAIASHLEAGALLRAREAMQGGLDRLPSVARRVAAEAAAPLTEVVRTATIVEPPAAALSAGPGAALAPSGGPSLGPVAVASSAAPPLHEEVPVALLDPGDLVEVRSGEIMPIDGEIVEGEGSLDRSPLTGESLPARVGVGEAVEAGLVLRQGPVVVRTTAIGEDTRLSELILSARTWRERPARIQTSLEWFTVFWIPLVLVGAPLLWALTGEVYLMLLLWVVACPCALLLAAPVPHAVALSRAGAAGMVVRGGTVLERAAAVDLVLLDKTGTLTRGEPKLERVVVASGSSEDGALRMAGGLEARSNHPYAGVIRATVAARELTPSRVRDLKDGSAGVEGVLQGRELRFGRADWIEADGVELPARLQAALDEARDEGLGASVLASGGQARAVFVFRHDDVRPGTKELVETLHAQGIRVELLSGDSEAAVDDMARALGIPSDLAQGEMSPEQKTEWVIRRSQSHVTLMAGDGFNDAGALAAADVGVAVGSGDQVNLDSADVLQPGDDPRRLAELLTLSRQTRSVVRQNIAFSVLIVGILVIGAVTGVQSSLALGVLVHELSALVVVLNGLRLAEERRPMAVLGRIIADLWRELDEAVRLLVRRPTA